MSRPLRRVLSSWDGAAIAVGIIIGSGIFAKPGLVARTTGSVGLSITAWIVGGLLALLDALIIAELASMYPRAGGNYAFLKNAYGPFPAFMNGWLSTLITYPASQAAFAVFFSSCLSRLTRGTDAPLLPVAYALLLGLGGLNALGLTYGRITQSVFAVSKVGLLLVVVVLAFVLPSSAPPDAGPAIARPAGFGILIALGTALLGVLWTYDGYADVAVMAGEMREPGRNVPRALMGSMAAVIVIYVLANISFFVALPFSAVAESSIVISDVAAALLGPRADTFVTAIAMVSVFGALNGTLLAGPRITYAIARDGLMFRPLAFVSRGQTPVAALALQVAVALCLLATAGTVDAFDILTNNSIFVIWCITFFATLSLVVFRIRYPDAPRPFRLPFYPYTIVVHLVVSFAVLASTIYESYAQVKMGLVIMAAGVPVYLVWGALTGAPAATKRLSPQESAQKEEVPSD